MKQERRKQDQLEIYDLFAVQHRILVMELSWSTLLRFLVNVKMKKKKKGTRVELV